MRLSSVLHVRDQARPHGGVFDPAQRRVAVVAQQPSDTAGPRVVVDAEATLTAVPRTARRLLADRAHVALCLGHRVVLGKRDAVSAPKVAVCLRQALLVSRHWRAQLVTRVLSAPAVLAEPGGSTSHVASIGLRKLLHPVSHRVIAAKRSTKRSMCAAAPWTWFRGQRSSRGNTTYSQPRCCGRAADCRHCPRRIAVRSAASFEQAPTTRTDPRSPCCHGRAVSR